jgi:SAM-dependent methyltransferase
MALSQEDVVSLYEILLGRQPESSGAIKSFRRHCPNMVSALREVVRSEEYRQVRMKAAQEVIRTNQDVGPQKIDVETDERRLATLLGRVEKVFSRYGDADPYWSVLTTPQYRKATVKAHLDEFFKTGEGSANLFINALTRNGIEPTSISSVLELGCGVGRVTVHLARMFKQVVAVDISPGHVEIARQIAEQQKIGNVELKHLNSMAGITALPEVDALYTVIVLQHNPPPVMKVMLEALLKKVKPGGVAYFQVPVLAPGYHFDVDEYLRKPEGDIEQHALPQHVIFSIFAKLDFQPLEVLPDSWVSMPVLSCSFLAKRRL